MDFDITIVDMDILNEARTVMKKRWPEMVEDYLEDVGIYIENIKTGFANGDKKAVAGSAHPLKSSSNGMGFTGLGAVAEKIEYDTKDAIESDHAIQHLEVLVPLLEEGMKIAAATLHATLENAAENAA